jgi:hypothetical protein
MTLCSVLWPLFLFLNIKRMDPLFGGKLVEGRDLLDLLLDLSSKNDRRGY